MALLVSTIRLVKKFTLPIDDPMKTLKVVTALVILFGEVILHAEGPPRSPEAYSLISEIGKMLTVDIDAKIKELGIRIHSCELIRDNSQEKARSEVISSYTSLQSCLTDSLIGSLRRDSKRYPSGREVTYFKLWALDADGRILPPLIVRWHHSHKSWFSLLAEGFRLKTDRISQYLNFNPISNPCQLNVNDFQQRDFGNFIGDLEISVTEARNLSDYFETGRLKSVLETTKTNSIRGNVKTPKVINGARMYDGEFKVKTELEISGEQYQLKIRLRSNLNMLALNDSESLLIRLLNFFVRKNYCVRGNLEVSADGAEAL